MVNLITSTDQLQAFCVKAANFDYITVDTEFLRERTYFSKLWNNRFYLVVNLKIISRHGVGYDNIDLKASKKKGLTLAITATANAVAVAEHVMFMMLHISKRGNMYDDTVKSGKFNNRNKLPKTIELWNKNILIVGFGRIGQALIKRCLGFEMNVFVYDPFVSKDIIKKHGGTKVENLIDASKTMDAMSLHVPLNQKTKNMIDYKFLKDLKKNCIIINASRGGVVNEVDLDQALNEDLIFGAGLDVFETEPPNENNLLLKNKKVFIRADLNVPIKSGKITSSQRIEASLATINYCLKAGAKVMVTSHLGRPKEGEYNPEFSLEPVVEFLENNLNKKIHLIKDWITQSFDVEAGEIVVLENCRFNVGESDNNENLAKPFKRQF